MNNRRFRNGQPVTKVVAAAGLGVMIAAVMAGCGGDKSLAKVGDQNITQKDYLAQAESAPEGAQILSSMIAQIIVNQEAKSKGVSPTDEQVNAWIADAEKTNPQLEQSLAKDHDEMMARIKTIVCVDNILQKDAGITPTVEQQWWTTHHDMFDQQAAVTIIPLVFDSMQKAEQGAALLKKGSSPKDVAASLGDPTFSANGVQSPPQTKDQALAIPALKPVIDQLFGPSAKAGYVTAPVADFPQKGKTGIVEIGKVIPAKTATLGENKRTVDRFIAAEYYVKNTLHSPISPQATEAYYTQMTQVVNQQFVAGLLQSYYKANKVTVEDPKFKTAIDSQMQAMNSAGGAPGGAVPPAAAAAAAPVPGG